MTSHTNDARRRLLATLPALALTPLARADDASALADAVHGRPVGRDVTTLSRMELAERGREPRVRRLVTYRLDRGRGESAYLARFLDPKDIAGVGLLSLTRADGSTDQSLFLPELDRVRKVSGDRKGGRFVGSDLYFEDLQERKPQRDTHRLLGREVLAGVTCDILESVPVDADDSVYLKRLNWIDRTTAMALRIDYFERDPQTVSKRWLALERQRIQGFWTVTTSSMADLAQGSETRLIVESARYDRKLPDRLFTPRALADERYESEFRL
ncbi:outer membrane lipoprotein-sorting protein [Rubrivivax albus]|uniref:Outer membrane lipoprotein-sorting protein n=1 Tax=Rubrivivax albus TaxID=2499835 RepID=A0A437JZF7_9BURK|nr:outer membrane lipoprotein-sorting protein [Rubrivivax albus]RVT53433.1 outer membrane lipoprotein-sorting protein [Rubrivivax albus]